MFGAKHKAKKIKKAIVGDKLSEYEEQKIVVRYLEAKKILFSATAQETFTKSRNQKTKNKLKGVRPGLPDLIICPNEFQTKHGKPSVIFIEMKKSKTARQKKDDLSDAQKLRKEHLLSTSFSCDQISYGDCYGAQEAIQFLQNYLI